jgi:hypothetical protein
MAVSEYIVHLYDIRTQEIYAQVATSAISYDYEMDAPGSANISIPMDVSKLDGTPLKPADIFPCRTAIAIQRGSELVWGGIVWQYNVDLSSRFIALDAGGYFSYYKYRHTNRAGVKFKNKETTEIVKWFILEINNGPSYGNGINTNVSGLQPVAKRLNKSWNPYEYKSIYDVIEDMADEIAAYDPQTFKYTGGFFFYFEPYFVDDLHIGNKMINTDSRHPVSNGITLAQGVNCEFSSISVDGNSMANAAYVVGATNGEPTLTPHAERRNVVFAAEIPYMDAIVTESTEKTDAQLRWRAKSALAYGSTPIILPTAVTYPNMYRPSQFKPGMLVRVTSDDGFLDLDKAEYVITKVSVSVSTDGSDRLTLDMVQSSLFTEVEDTDG